MGTVLFINGDKPFTARIQDEAKDHAAFNVLTSSSLLSGLKLVMDQNLSLSGIYIETSDSSFSLLKFIETTFSARPATPIFLIDNSISIDSQSFLSLNQVRKTFLSSTSFSTFIEPLASKPPAGLTDLSRIKNKTPEHGYLGIPLIDFIHEKTYPFDVFIETAHEGYSHFAQAESPVNLDYLLQASASNLFLFVNEQEIKRRKAILVASRSSFMTSPHLSPLWKTAEVMFNAKRILNELKNETASDHLVEQTLNLLRNLFQMVSLMSLEPGNKDMTYFVQQAKNSDKTIAAVTLSMLMCRNFGFERNAIIEILGLASLLQDISLFNSPHGDISMVKFEDLVPEAQPYFTQHPLISADMLAQNTDVPAIVLQVIRQQHECKDRTGYPNRIGGLQLHPMAEVLSLINAFLDIAGDTPTMINDVTLRKLESTVFVHYSEPVVTAFKSVLGAFTVSPLIAL